MTTSLLKLLIAAKKKYYSEIIKDLKTSNVSQWFSKLKRLCSYDRIKTELVIVNSIKHLDNQEQAEAITDIPDFDSETIPVFRQEDVQKHLKKIKLKNHLTTCSIQNGRWGLEICQTLCYWTP